MYRPNRPEMTEMVNTLREVTFNPKF